VSADVTFITGGMAGGQQTFAENCGDGSKVLNLLPIGEKSGFTQGKDIHAGADLDERKEVFGQLGDFYITVEGGPGVILEASAAFQRGAAILPLIRTGGASSGMTMADKQIPQEALTRPLFATEAQWELLTTKGADVEKTGAAIAEMVTAFVQQQDVKVDLAALDAQVSKEMAVEAEAKTELDKGFEQPLQPEA